MYIPSKLPNVGTTIFSVMSALAQKHDAINLSQGFPNFDCDERLKKLVHHYVDKGYNQYAPMPGIAPLRKALSQKVERLYATQYDANEEITITAGATQALFTAIAAFVQADDEVILVEPAYDSYKPAVELMGGKVVPYELNAPDWEIDWAAFAECISSRTRMIIFNTPHNPTGKIWKKSDMEALTQLVEGTDIILLSDEVYEHLVFDEAQHHSILAQPDLRKRSLATFSFGKTLHATGWKLGYVVGDAALMREFRKVHQFNVFSANNPLQYAIADYIQNPETYLSLRPLFEQKRNLFMQYLQDSAFEAVPAQGTYFQLASYANISDEPDVAFAERMTKDYGVAVIPVSVFYTHKIDHKVIRFCFAKTDDLLHQAGKLIQKLPKNVTI